MKRSRVSALALLTGLALPSVAACGSGGGSGSSGVPDDAQVLRASVAKAYWKVDGAVPPSVDVSVGRGKFVTCSKDKPDQAAYRVENLIDAKDGGVTEAQLLTQLKSALAPRGWTITLNPVQPSPTRNAGVARTTAYIARQGGLELRLLLQERTKTVEAGGFLDVWSGCSGLGGGRKELLAKYAPGDSVDVYRPTTATPHPVPTGGPTSAP